jgi:hypothetical protein
MDNQIYLLIGIGIILYIMKNNYRFANVNFEKVSDFTPASSTDPRDYYKQESFTGGTTSINLNPM